MRDFDAFREEVYDAFAPEPVTPEARAFTEATGKRSIPGVSLGKTRERVGGPLRLAVFTSDYQLGAAIKAHAAGEAVVYMTEVALPRVTANYTKKVHRTKFMGVQVMPDHMRWVGTGSIFVPLAEDPTKVGQVTNRHVTGFTMRRGDLMRQGGERYAWHVGHSNFSTSVPIQFDSAVNGLNEGVQFYPRWSDGLDANLAGIRRMRDSDLQQTFVHTGQTIGTRQGRCIATDIDDHYINYGEMGVAQLTDHAAFVADDGRPFSVGGHSGSTIISVRDRMAVALLDSGGPGPGGLDITYASADLPGSIRAAGGIPELVS